MLGSAMRARHGAPLTSVRALDLNNVRPITVQQARLSNGVSYASSHEVGRSRSPRALHLAPPPRLPHP